MTRCTNTNAILAFFIFLEYLCVFLLVKTQLSRGQPVSLEQSALLMQDFAQGTVEGLAKMYVDKFGAFHMPLGVPMDCVLGLDSGHGGIADVPIVLRYYTDTHACVAVRTSFPTSTNVLNFEESRDVLNPADWNGKVVGAKRDFVTLRAIFCKI